MALQEVGARLITQGESQFLGSMMRAQKAVTGVADSADRSTGPLSRLSTIGTAVGVALGQALYNGAMMAGRALISFGTESVTAASDLNETWSKTEVIFGDAFGNIKDGVNEIGSSLGQSTQEMLDGAATFGIFGKSAGLAGSDLSDFSLDMVELSSDLASFHNTSPEEAITAIGAALRGESEPIRKYGVLLDDASLRQEALALGITKTTKEALTPQQRVLAVQSLLFKQTADAQGDFARTSDGLANQQRILAANIENTKAKLGTALLPIVNKVSKSFNTMLQSKEFQKGLDGFMAGLTKAIGWIETNWPAISAIFQQVWNTIITGITWVKGLIEPFIQSLTAMWQANSAQATTIVSAMWNYISGLFMTIVNTVLGIVAILTPLIQGFLQGMSAWWAENGDAIIATVIGLWNSISQVFTAASGLVLAIVSFLVNNIMVFWQNHGDTIMAIIQFLWDTVVVIFTTVTSVISSIFEAFTALLQGDTETFAAKMKEAWDTLWAAIKTAAETAWKALSAWFLDIIQQILGFFINTDWASIGKGIIDGIWKGIEDGWDWLKRIVIDKAKSLLSAIKDALHIESPSKDFEKIGLLSMQGWGQGMEKGMPDLLKKGLLAANLTMAPAMGMVSAGPSNYTYNTSNAYNLSVLTNQSPTVVQRSFEMMKMIAG